MILKMTLPILLILKIFNEEEGIQSQAKNLGDDLMLWYIDGCNNFGSGIFGSMVLAAAMGIILIFIISIIFKIIRAHEKESIKILKRRYSKGEIIREDYNEMKKDIK